MTLRSPIVAMLWENWRLTRVEAAWHLALGTVAAAAVLMLFASIAPNQDVKDFGARIALVLVVLPHMIGWISVNQLNVARPGFPFYLLYTRPVRTAVAVGIPMAYQAAAAAALYVVSALLLRITSGYAFPLLAVAAWIAGVNLLSMAVFWSMRHVVGRMLALLAVSMAWSLVPARLLSVEDVPGPDWAPPNQWPTLFDLPLAYYVWIGVVGLAAFALTVAAVKRQRHGEGRAAMSWAPGNGYPERFISLFRFPCPTSSATRAQIWFELKSRGLPLLTIGVVLAILNPLIFAVSHPIDAALFDYQQYVDCRADGCFYARAFAVLFAMLSMVTVLVGINAFGIRWRPGRLCVSAFEMTPAYGTAQLAGLKVLVRSVCQLVAVIAVGTSVWASGAILVADKAFGGPLDTWQRAIEGAVGALTAYQQLALAVLASIGVVVFVASWAALGALATRYPRRYNIAGALLLLYGLALVLLALARQRGIGPEISVSAVLRATSWVSAAAMLLATGYLLWRGFAERLLTMRHAWGAVVLSATFAAAWLMVLRAAGLSLTGMSAADAAWMLSPALLPLMVSALAPWSLSRIRHT